MILPFDKRFPQPTPRSMVESRRRWFCWYKTPVGWAPAIYYDAPPGRSINSPSPERTPPIELQPDAPSDFDVLGGLFPPPTMRNDT